MSNISAVNNSPESYDNIDPFPSEKTPSQQDTEQKVDRYAPNRIVTTFVKWEKKEKDRVSAILSDGSIWDVKKDNTKGDLPWKKQDVIILRYKAPEDTSEEEPSSEESSSQPIIELFNRNTQTSILATLTNKCADYSKAYFVEKISPNSYGLVVGGKIWSIGYWGHDDASKLQKGDRVLLNRGDHTEKGDYNIITPEGDFIWVSEIFPGYKLVQKSS